MFARSKWLRFLLRDKLSKATAILDKLCLQAELPNPVVRVRQPRLLWQAMLWRNMNATNLSIILTANKMIAPGRARTVVWNCYTKNWMHQLCPCRMLWKHSGELNGVNAKVLTISQATWKFINMAGLATENYIQVLVRKFCWRTKDNINIFG